MTLSCIYNVFLLYSSPITDYCSRPIPAEQILSHYKHSSFYFPVFFGMTQWAELELCIQAWVRGYLPVYKHGQLVSGYTTGENASLSSSIYYHLYIFRGG